MTKMELIGLMATAAGISREEARLALEAFTDNVTEALAKGQTVRLVGFGTFVSADRKAGLARNPQTGEVIPRPASRTARFKPGEGLKTALNA